MKVYLKHEDGNLWFGMHGDKVFVTDFKAKAKVFEDSAPWCVIVNKLWATGFDTTRWAIKIEFE